MSEYLKTSIEINESAIEAKLLELVDSQTMLEIHNVFAKYCDPYVPMLEGPLSQTVEITPEYIRYNQPYAHYQYYGEEFNHTLDYHPLASAKWDEAMLRDRRDEFIANVKEILIRRAKELYGR